VIPAITGDLKGSIDSMVEQ